jgi:hypothetical protein
MTSAGPSRLSARPSGDAATHPATGTFELADGALLRVPAAVETEEPCPLLVLFTGQERRRTQVSRSWASASTTPS